MPGFKQTLFYLIIAPKSKSSATGIQMSQREVLKKVSLSEKVKVPDLIRKMKNCMLKVTKTSLLLHCKEGKRNSCNPKIIATVNGECLIKMEKV